MLNSKTSGLGPDLVLLHGWGFNSAVWDTILPQLQKHYRITCIDLPGFGSNVDCLAFNSLSEIVNEILEVAPEQAIYMGWSLGGLVSQFIAIHFPQRVKELINVTTSPCFIREEHWPGIEERVLVRFGEELNNDYQRTLARFLLLQLHGCDNSRELLRSLEIKLFKYPPQQAALTAGLSILLSTDLRAELKQIICPSRYIFGQLDALVPAKIAEPMQQWLPNATIKIMARASHAPFISHPEGFLASTGLSYD